MKKPNVLILFTDQQRFDTIHAAGYSHMITPNLDRLAAEGCTFEYAHSTNPVCMPARHDMFTGLPGRVHGYFGNRRKPINDYDIPTLPRIFSENGYRTAGIGKLHFFPARMHHGFNELHLMEELPERWQDDEYLRYLRENNLGHLQNIHGVRPHIYHVPQNSQTELRHHGSVWVADRAIKWLEENGEEPFFLFVGWIHPHPPWNIPEEYKGLYRNVKLPDPVPVSRCFPDTEGVSAWHGDTDTEEQKRRIREAYFASITLVDHNIGRILDYLEGKSLLDNTLVIFTSDHGEMLQDKGIYSKEVPYEGSVRIPLIIRYPEKFKPGSVRREFADLFDIMPTCLDVCGLEYTSEKYRLPGESLCVENPKRDRSHQVSSYGSGSMRWVMCRNYRYKYVYNYLGGYEEFYDLQNDPGETVNLVNTREGQNAGKYPQGEFEELKRKAFEYEEKWGPEGSVENGRLKVYDGPALHPSARGKFHLWANRQFQWFDKRPNEIRGAQFIRELRHAVSDYDHSGVELKKVFNDPEWIRSFMDNWRNFGSGDEICDMIFDEDINSIGK